MCTLFQPTANHCLRCRANWLTAHHFSSCPALTPLRPVCFPFPDPLRIRRLLRTCKVFLKICERSSDFRGFRLSASAMRSTFHISYFADGDWGGSCEHWLSAAAVATRFSASGPMRQLPPITHHPSSPNIVHRRPPVGHPSATPDPGARCSTGANTYTSGLVRTQGRWTAYSLLLGPIVCCMVEHHMHHGPHRTPHSIQYLHNS
jgi:hypothetical protein